MMRILATAFGLSCAVAAHAAELRSVTLDKRDGFYYATSEVWLDADLDAVFDVLSDWDISEQFSSLIVESRNLDPDDLGRPGFYMQNKGCVLFFCRTVEREGWVELKDNELIRAVAIGDRSDFEVSDERWHFEREADGTRILYEMDMKPKFWIPPLIGTYAIKRKIRNDGLEALERVERYVNERQSGQSGQPGQTAND